MSEFKRPLEVVIKAGNTTESPWLMVSADDPTVLAQYLNGVKATGTLELIAEVSALFQGVSAVAHGAGGVAAPQDGPQQSSGWGAQGGAQGASAGSTAAPVQHGTNGGGQTKVCPHGPRTRRTGTNSRGPWVAHFCSLQKGDPSQCDPIWGD